jgi:hypothetical protein
MSTPPNRRRCRAEIALGAACFALLALTAAWPDWIEAIFGVEPDGGSGAVEWGLVAVLAACAFGLPWHGVRGLRRIAVAPSSTAGR